MTLTTAHTTAPTKATVADSFTASSAFVAPAMIMAARPPSITVATT